MNRSRKLRTQIALATAVCFGTLAALAAGTPVTPASDACDRPVWSAVITWGAGDCR